MNTENQNVIRLPLWRTCLENMSADGLAYGKTYPAEYFEAQLRCQRDSMEFGLAISEIRRELEKKGFYISGRGQKGNQFVILPPSSNADVMQHYSSMAMDALKRGVILGTNTRLDTLTNEERRRHEAMLEKLAIRTALCSRSAQIGRVIKKHAPNLLKAG